MQLAPRSVNTLATVSQPKAHVTRDEVVRLIDAETNPSRRILLRLLWTLGGRISEIVGDAHAGIVGLHGEDCFRRDGRYFVRMQRLKRFKIHPGSPSEPKFVYEEIEIPFDVGLALEDYKRIFNVQPQDKLFPFGRRQAWKIIHDAGVRVLGRSIHPHMFRHGFVYELISRGASPHMIALLTGHASLTSTMAYYHPSDEEKAKIREEMSI